MGKVQVIKLPDEDRAALEKIVKARTAQAQVVMRARILLLKADGETVDSIAEKVMASTTCVQLCLKKYKEGGLRRALHDDKRSGRPPVYTDEERAWITSVACQKPCELGLAAEVWTYPMLARHIKKNAESGGYPRLAKVSKTTIFRILDDLEIKPFKIRYYCERRDPEFDEKMHNVLLVYKQLSFRFDEEGELIASDDGEPQIHTLSYDEKPGIQAIGTTAPDLPPTKENGVTRRDYEYKRRGTIALLAAIDLLTGKAFPLVSDTHNSSDFVAFLKMLDTQYPEGDTIRLVLDNLAVHTSKETKAFLATRPGRFQFVFTPKHGSWLNLIESFFSKMTRQFLRGISVKSKEELAGRIYKWFDEINETPVVFHWKYRMEEIDPSEKVKIDLAI